MASARVGLLHQVPEGKRVSELERLRTAPTTVRTPRSPANGRDQFQRYFLYLNYSHP